MTRTVADAALLMRVISRPDPRDWTSLPPEDIDWLEPSTDRCRGLRVGLHLDAGCGAPVRAGGGRRRRGRGGGCFEAGRVRSWSRWPRS